MAIAAPRIYEGTRIPSPIPTMIAVPEELRREADILEINFGPNHPSMHGVLRLVLELDGETVVGLKAIIGYLHTGFEKSMEQKTWWKAIPYAPRMDYVSFQANELAFVMAIEKLLGIEVPPKAVWMRTLLAELNRIHSHLVWLGTSALELGAISPFWYAFRERDRVLDLFELVAGARMHTRYFQVGGLAEDIPRGFFPQCREFCEVMPKAVDQYESMLSENPIWLARTKGVGLLSADDALALGQSGPVARASGIDWDLRKAAPYLAYGDVDFDVPVRWNGDVYDRYKVHMDEMRESVRIVEQTLEGMPPGPVDRGRPQGRAAAARGAAHVHGDAHPPLQARDRGLHGARGRGVPGRRVAARRVRLLRLLRRRPAALARAFPSTELRRAPGDRDLHGSCTHRRHGRRRRLARHRHGRGRPLVALADQIQEVAARYPDRRSAMLPALRMAQERYGWLSPEALAEVADALDYTTAYCLSVASFYDMFHLEPVGKHQVEVCTNLSCALVGAQEVVRAFESELGIRAGETTEDGQVTFRVVECLNGCGYAPVIAVDHRQRHPVRPEDVPSIVEELRAGS